MRLFASVPLPPDVHDHLDIALSSVRYPSTSLSTRPSLLWSDPDNWHITVAFYGEVSEHLCGHLTEEISEGLRQIAPFSIHARAAGSFSGRRLWVGVGGDIDSMKRIKSTATAAGEDLGIRFDERLRNRPHITVASAVAGTDFSEVVHALSIYRGIPWQVNAIQLVESIPGAGRSGGPLYRVVGESALDG